MTSQLASDLDCIKQCLGVYEHNNMVNRVRVDYWTTEWVSIASNNLWNWSILRFQSNKISCGITVPSLGRSSCAPSDAAISQKNVLTPPGTPISVGFLCFQQACDRFDAFAQTRPRDRQILALNLTDTSSMMKLPRMLTPHIEITPQLSNSMYQVDTVVLTPPVSVNVSFILLNLVLIVRFIAVQTFV